MQGNLYVGVSAQVALQRRLDTIAHNVANASTAGFRAEEVRFETVLSRAGADPVAFATSGPTFLSRRSGELVRTDNLFDVAVEGDAWLAIQTPGGTGLYPRRPHAHDRRRASCRRSTAIRCSMRAAPPCCSTPTPARPASPATAPSRRPIARSAPSASSTSTSRANLTRFENSGVIPDRPAHARAGFHQHRHAAGLHRERQRQCRHGDVAAHHRHARLRDGLGFACRLGDLAAGSH